MSVDRERALARLDDLDRYLDELRPLIPDSLEAYRVGPGSRRACERLLQIAVECVLDVSGILVSGLRLGLPGEENDILEKLEAAGVLSPATAVIARRMRALRNVIVHEYAKVDDAIVYETLTEDLGDFDRMREELVRAIRAG